MLIERGAGSSPPVAPDIASVKGVTTSVGASAGEPAST
jgi:hypothetical protein